MLVHVLGGDSRLRADARDAHRTVDQDNGEDQRSITAELQGATTQYGCKYGGQRWGTVGPRYENPDGTSWRWPRNLCPLCERPRRRYDPHGFRDAPRNSIRGPIDFRGKVPRNSAGAV